ncbi:MAG TPA: HNH endonuclease [Terriglobales bacterium]|nr:HNH endonuclease [Terriglobales bacterium]
MAPAACGRRWRKEATTDRNYRYRARACIAPGPMHCAFCGVKGRLDVGHLDGEEANSNPSNLAWLCRPCNVRMGNAMRRAGLGRLTRQYNPRVEGARTLAAWLQAARTATGQIHPQDLPIERAIAIVKATSPSQRSAFAQEIWAIRRARGTDQTAVPF